MRFRAEQRIRRQGDFLNLRTNGRRHDCGAFLVVMALPSPDRGPHPTARVGVVASKASVGIAPFRNRAKRRLREAFRAHQQLVPPEYDLLLIARRSINRLEYTAIERKFVDACRKLFPTPRADD